MLKQALENQYNKALNILEEAVRKYDENLWFDNKNYKSPAWHVVYHAVFYANIYCSPTEAAIAPWPKARENYHFYGKTPWLPFEKVELKETYSKADMLEFIGFVRGKISAYLDKLRPEERCWPHWYDEPQLEFQINSIRHLQHHCAEVIERHDIVCNFPYIWQ
jgi:hypothetical protein